MMPHSPAVHNLRDFLIRFFSRIEMVRRLFLVMAVLTLAITALLPTTYTTTGEIIVLATELYQNDKGTPGGELSQRYLPVTLKDLETEATILRSIPLLTQTITTLYNEGELFIEPSPMDLLIKQPLQIHFIQPTKEFIKSTILKSSKPNADSEKQNPEIVELTKMVLDSLEIVPLPGSNVIVINFLTKNMEMGRIFVDRLMNEYLALRNSLMTGATDDDLFLQKKRLYQNRLTELSKKKTKLFSDNEIHNPKEELSIILQTINKETAEYTQLSESLIKAKSWQKYYEASIAKLAFARLDNMTIPSYFFGGATSFPKPDTEMQRQIELLNALRSQYDVAILTYAPDTPQVQQLTDQLLLAKDRIVATLKSRQKELQQENYVLDVTITQKQNRIDTYKKRASILTEVILQETGIDTELGVVTNALSNYSRQFEEIQSEKLLNREQWRNVKVLSYAPVPLEPSSPKKKVVVIIGLISSAITAIVLGFVSEIFDQRFHTPNQLAAELDLPVIAVVDAHQEKKRIPFSLHPLRFIRWLTQ